MFLYVWLRCAKRFAIVSNVMVTRFKAEKHKSENKYAIQWEGNPDFCNVISFAETQEQLDKLLSRSSRPRVPTEKVLVSVSDATTDDDLIPNRRHESSKSAEVTRINKNLGNRLHNLATEKAKARDSVQPLTLTDSPEEDSSPERATTKLKTCSKHKIISKKMASNVVRDSKTMFTPLLNDENSQQFSNKSTENCARYNTVRQTLKDVSNCFPIPNTNLGIKKKINSHASDASSKMKGANRQKTKVKIHLRPSETRNKEHMSRIIQDAHLTEFNNDEQVVNSIDARIKKYMKTIEYLNMEIGDLKKELEKEKKDYGELKRNFEISQREEKRLKELNHELQQSCINSCHEFKSLFNQHQNMPCNTTEETRYLPSGFIRKDGSQIHLGRGIWIAKDTYYLAMANITSNAMFVKNLAVAVFGSKVLTVSTLTGKGSNRNQQEKKPENQLDPRKVFAIKDFYRWWLVSKRHMESLAADMESDRVKEYIRKKISDMKDGPDKKGRRKKKTSNVPHAEDVRTLAQEVHPPDETEIPEEDCEDVGNNEMPDGARTIAQELHPPDEMEIPEEDCEVFGNTEIPNAVRTITQEVHPSDEMEIPEEDCEDFHTNEIPNAVRTLAQEVYPSDEMEIPEEDCEDIFETEIPDDMRSLVQEDEGLEGDNRGSIYDGESCNEILEEKRGEVAEPYIPNYNSFVDFEQEAYIPSSLIQKVHAAAYINCGIQKSYHSLLPAEQSLTDPLLPSSDANEEHSLTFDEF